MAGDDEWVSNVKRWCLEQNRSRAEAVPGAIVAPDDELGDKAAHPAMQARHWPDASAVA